MDWRQRIPTNQAHRRASGRRHYNSVRRDRRLVRRLEVLRMLNRRGYFVRGVQAEIAAELGVSKQTISSDVKAILKVSSKPCPRCGVLLDNRVLDDQDYFDRLRK